MTDVLKLYPSGFLGSAVVPQTEPVPVVTTARQLFNKGLNPKVTPYLANQEVVSLWDDTEAGTPEYKEFDFKVRIIKTAISAFGTETVVEWIGTQFDSPFFSADHSRWIDETLAFIYDGKPRKLSANNWRTLLIADNPPYKGERFSRSAKHYLMGEKLRDAAFAQPYRGALTVRQFVADWCARPDGIKDLLAQLNNLFGKR